MAMRGRERGMTLVELMFAASILAILMLGAGSIIATLTSEGDLLKVEADARDWLEARAVRLEAELKAGSTSFYDKYDAGGFTEIRTGYTATIKLHTDESGGVKPEHGGRALVSNTAADGSGADDMDLDGDGRVVSGSGNVPAADLVVFPITITVTLTESNEVITRHLVLLRP